MAKVLSAFSLRIAEEFDFFFGWIELFKLWCHNYSIIQFHGLKLDQNLYWTCNGKKKCQLLFTHSICISTTIYTRRIHVRRIYRVAVSWLLPTIHHPNSSFHHLGWAHLSFFSSIFLFPFKKNTDFRKCDYIQRICCVANSALRWTNWNFPNVCQKAPKALLRTLRVDCRCSANENWFNMLHCRCFYIWKICNRKIQENFIVVKKWLDGNKFGMN